MPEESQRCTAGSKHAAAVGRMHEVPRQPVESAVHGAPVLAEMPAQSR
jgi:hypothetical protein